MRMNYIDNIDCLQGMKEIPDGSVDLVLCDLPYGTTACSWDSVLPFEQLWNHYNRVLKPNGAAVLFAAQPFTTKLIHSNRRAFRYCWYWLKNHSTGFTYARYQPMRSIEDICVFYKKHGTYNPQGLQVIENPRTMRKKWKAAESVYHADTLMNEYTPRFKNYPKNVLRFDTERGLHPTQKPVPLMEYLIKTYTNPGEIVLDNCMGSGTTAVACIRTGRNFLGYELDVDYHRLALARVAAEGRTT